MKKEKNIIDRKVNCGKKDNSFNLEAKFKMIKEEEEAEVD